LYDDIPADEHSAEHSDENEIEPQDFLA
jgi:hypothetical protein